MRARVAAIERVSDEQLNYVAPMPPTHRSGSGRASAAQMNRTLSVPQPAKLDAGPEPMSEPDLPGSARKADGKLTSAGGAGRSGPSAQHQGLVRVASSAKLARRLKRVKSVPKLSQRHQVEIELAEQREASGRDWKRMMRSMRTLIHSQGRLQWAADGPSEQLMGEIFSRYDLDRSANMDPRELGYALKSIGFDAAIVTDELRDLKRKRTARNVQLLSREDFIEICSNLYRKEKSKQASDHADATDGTARQRMQKLSRYFRKNVDITDIDLSAHVREQLPWYIINPRRPFSLLWDGTQLLMLVYVSFSVTTVVGFHLPGPPLFSTRWCIDLFVDVYFLTDVFLAFFTAYENEHGRLIFRMQEIAKTYVFGMSGRGLGWFWLDVISGFPFEYIQMAVDPEGGAGGMASNLRTIKVAKAVRLAKLAKLARLTKTVKFLSRAPNESMLRFVERHVQEVTSAIAATGMLCAGCFMAHVLACGWFYVGWSNDGPANCMRQPLTGSFMHLTTEQNCYQGWVLKKGWEDPNWVGHPDSRPALNIMYLEAFTGIFMRAMEVDTNAEKLYLVCAEIVYNIIFGAVAGFMFSAIDALSVNTVEYKKRMEQLREFCHSKGLPKDLTTQLKHFKEFLYENKTVFDESAILSELPPHMRAQVSLSSYGDMIKDSFFFLGLEHNESAVIMICMELRATAALEGSNIYTEGDIKGQVLLTTHRNNTTEGISFSPAAQQHNLLVEFRLGLMNERGGDSFDWFWGDDETNKTRRFEIPFKEFRQQLDECSGVYMLQPGQPVSQNGEVVYQQQLSQAAQVRSQHDSHIDKQHHKDCCRWQLQFLNGVWILENRRPDQSLVADLLIGILQTEDGEDQQADNLPLGEEVMWDFRDVELTSRAAEVPQVPVPVSVSTLLDSLVDGCSFGELEMLRLGGGTTSRTREATARAMTNCYLSTLSYDSYVKLKSRFPEEMTQNELFFKKTARKKGINRTRKVSLLEHSASGAVGDGRSATLSAVQENQAAPRRTANTGPTAQQPVGGTSLSTQVEQHKLILELAESIESVRSGQSNLESMVHKLGEWAYRLENQVASAAVLHDHRNSSQVTATEGVAVSPRATTKRADNSIPNSAAMISDEADKKVDAEIDGWIDEALDGRLQLLSELPSSQGTQLDSLVLPVEEANTLQATLYDEVGAKAMRKAWAYAVDRQRPPALAHASDTLQVAWRNGQKLRKLRLAARLEH